VVLVTFKNVWGHRALVVHAPLMSACPQHVLEEGKEIQKRGSCEVKSGREEEEEEEEEEDDDDEEGQGGWKIPNETTSGAGEKEKKKEKQLREAKREGGRGKSKEIKTFHPHHKIK